MLGSVTDHTARQEVDLSPIPFDQRSTERNSSEGRAAAFELGGDGFGRIHELELIDYGSGGLGAFSQTPILPGTSISLGFEMSWLTAQRGEVVWCTPCGHGYRVGILLLHRMAA